MQWFVILKKEILENWRNFKWIWVPIVFIIFAIMDPLTTYYLPKIMDTVGGVPEGSIIDIPMPGAVEAMMMSFGEISQLGILITVVIAMGVISGEMKSGVYELIMSKPVKYSNYITAKFASVVLLILLSLILALIAGWYYVMILFGDIAFTALLTSIAFYGCYFLLIIGIVLMVNTWVQSPGVVAFLSLIIIIALNVITSIYGHIFTWSPALLSNYIQVYLASGELVSEMWYSALIALLFTYLCLQFAILTLKNRAV